MEKKTEIMQDFKTKTMHHEDFQWKSNLKSHSTNEKNFLSEKFRTQEKFRWHSKTQKVELENIMKMKTSKEDVEGSE